MISLNCGVIVLHRRLLWSPENRLYPCIYQQEAPDGAGKMALRSTIKLNTVEGKFCGSLIIGWSNFHPLDPNVGQGAEAEFANLKKTKI